KLLVDADKIVNIAPPPGKYWVIIQGLLYLDEPRPERWIAVWLDHAPYAPYRDPVTGEWKGCVRCVNILRVTAKQTFIPIVGGYVQDDGLPRLQGQSSPIVVAYPDRLNIAVTPFHGQPYGAPVVAYVRLMIVEKDLK